MPFVDVSIRQLLGLVTSTPSEEDLQAAATRHGVVWDPLKQTLLPLAPLAPTKRPARAKQTAAANAVLPGDAAEPIQGDA